MEQDNPSLKIAFYGSSLVSAYWNGAATYYRGLVRALHERGHQVTFFEPDAYERQKHRDMPDPSWARVVVYPATEEGLAEVLDQARHFDVVVKASGVGVFDYELEKGVLEQRQPRQLIIFWDVDAPATLASMEQNPDNPFIGLVAEYDMVLTYGGGTPVVEAYQRLGARQCVPVYNALDPQTHHPVPPQEKFGRYGLVFMGNRLPDREERVKEFFLKAARLQTNTRFALGGSGWNASELPPNVDYIGHVYTDDHNALNSSPLAVLNISRDSMASNGFSPATRVFEAAGAGACLISDYWEGIAHFLEPGKEVLTARNGEEVAAHLHRLKPEEARAIGQAARKRVMRDHSYSNRAAQVEALLMDHL